METLNQPLSKIQGLKIILKSNWFSNLIFYDFLHEIRLVAHIIAVDVHQFCSDAVVPSWQGRGLTLPLPAWLSVRDNTMVSLVSPANQIIVILTTYQSHT